MNATETATLDLAELEAYDTRAPQGASERRFLCPLCGDGKPKNAAHRSLTVNTQSGAWHCWRCNTTGKLKDFWEERERPASKRQRERASLTRSFALPTSPTLAPAHKEKDDSWRTHLQGLQSLAATPGEKYLAQRGIALEFAGAADVRFSSSWLGRPAVVFPLHDEQSTLVAAQGRYVDGRDNPKARTTGDKRASLFATPGALAPKMPALLITEAPIDALSLAAAGFPALALCGTTGPAWLPRACAFRRVLLAFDADEAGDRAAATLAGELESFGACCERLRPEAGKDWNEVLCVGGAADLADLLAWRVLLDEREREALQ